MFERYTERARMTIVLAQEEARGFNHNYIGTEHLLLGLLREEEGVAARVLKSLKVTAEEVRAHVARIVGQGDEVTTGQIPFTPRAKRVQELALREAMSLGHNYIGTEHVLLGLARENEGVGARILLDLDIGGEKIRDEVLRLLSPRPPANRQRLWRRRDVNVGQTWQRADDVFRVVAVADAPTVVLENVADKTREWHVIESPNFAELQRLIPTGPGDIG